MRKINHTINQLVKLLLGGSTLRASENVSRKTIPGFTIFWNGSTWRRSRILDQNIVLPSVCVFHAFKAFVPSNLRTIAIDCRGSWTKAALEKALKASLKEEVRTGRNGKPYVAGLLLNGMQVARRDWSKKHGTLFNVNEINLNSHLRGIICTSAMKALGINNCPFPAHPSWITTRKKPGVFYIVVCERGDMFADIATEANGGHKLDPQILNVLRIRAGKDAFGEVLTKTECYNLLVYKEELSNKGEDGKLPELDGAFHVKSSNILLHGEHALVKGVAFLDGGRKGIDKARMIHSQAQTAIGPNGGSIPEDVDGWAYSSAFKWFKLRFPDGQDSMVVRISVGVTTWEIHEQKEAYKANLFYLILGRWGASTKQYIMKLLKSSAVRIAKNLDNLRDYMSRRVQNGLADCEDDVLSDSYISKYVTGLLPLEDPGVTSALNRIGKSFMSAYVPGSVYAGIIHKTHVSVDGGHIYEVQPGEFVPTREMREAIISGFHLTSKATGKWSERVCGVRYPNTTEGSFLDLTMSEHTLDDMSGIFAVVCLEAQVGWQSDCDDHALFLPGFESEIGVNDFSPIEKNVRPAEGALTPMSAYHHGRRSQELTALFVAAYMKCLAIIRDVAPDRLGEAKELLLDVAQAIQDSVQGIKKFNDTCMNINEIYDRSEEVIRNLTGQLQSDSATSIVIAGKVVGNGRNADHGELPMAVNAVYGVGKDGTSKAYDSHNAVRTFNNTLCNMATTPDERKILRELWVALDESNAHPHMFLVEALLEGVVGVTRQELIDDESLVDSLDPEKVRRAIHLYAHFMATLAQRGRVKQVRSLNGLAAIFTESDLAE